MVDVGSKRVTARKAVATARVVMRPETLRMIQQGEVPKGPALEVARIAGIQAAKKTSDLVPLCHPLPIDSVQVDLKPMGGSSVLIRAEVKTRGRTGVEMEALTAVSLAALTLYDMCKAMHRGIRIGDIELLHKSGGRSGTWDREDPDH